MGHHILLLLKSTTAITAATTNTIFALIPVKLQINTAYCIIFAIHKARVFLSLGLREYEFESWGRREEKK